MVVDLDGKVSFENYDQAVQDFELNTFFYFNKEIYFL